MHFRADPLFDLRVARVVGGFGRDCVGHGIGRGIRIGIPGLFGPLGLSEVVDGSARGRVGLGRDGGRGGGRGSVFGVLGLCGAWGVCVICIREFNLFFPRIVAREYVLGVA